MSIKKRKENLDAYNENVKPARQLVTENRERLDYAMENFEADGMLRLLWLRVAYFLAIIAF